MKLSVSIPDELWESVQTAVNPSHEVGASAIVQEALRGLVEKAYSAYAFEQSVSFS